jgi:signal-transduction protein with cAMP-binding, CBS, and nucleotidyltransferase domain
MTKKNNNNSRRISKIEAGQLMTEKLETINLLNTTQEAAIKMVNRNVSSLAIVDDEGKAFGIITEIW